MSAKTWVREFRRRWPAIESILRDGTVMYQARIVNGTVVVSRPHSTIMNCYVEGGQTCIEVDGLSDHADLVLSA